MHLGLSMYGLQFGALSLHELTTFLLEFFALFWVQ